MNLGVIDVAQVELRLAVCETAILSTSDLHAVVWLGQKIEQPGLTIQLGDILLSRLQLSYDFLLESSPPEGRWQPRLPGNSYRGVLEGRPEIRAQPTQIAGRRGHGRDLKRTRCES
eukprot:3503388-Rhodomonas_salina.1